MLLFRVSAREERLDFRFLLLYTCDDELRIVTLHKATCTVFINDGLFNEIATVFFRAKI